MSDPKDTNTDVESAHEDAPTVVVPLDRAGHIAAIGPMGALEDPDGFDRAMASYGK